MYHILEMGGIYILILVVVGQQCLENPTDNTEWCERQNARRAEFKYNIFYELGKKFSFTAHPERELIHRRCGTAD